LSEPYSLRFTNGNGAIARDVAEPGDLAGALGDLHPPRPVLVLIGGADSLDRTVARQIGSLFRDGLVPLLERLGAAVIDGGTDSGIMSLIGQARAAAGASFSLIGVAARGTVRGPGEASAPGTGDTPLEPNHSHFLLVPGERWGDEVPWIGSVAARLAAGAPSVTLAAGGGTVTRLDIDESLRAGRPTLLLAGSGGTTDELVGALRTDGLGAFGIDGRAGLLRPSVPAGVADLLGEILSGRRAP
jgi:hypothetical protein